MRKLLVLLTSLLLVMGCTSKQEIIDEIVDVCTLEKDGVCYEDGQFVIEEDAKITLGNLSVDVQQALIDAWNTKYPKYKDLIVLNEIGEMGDDSLTTSILQGENDIIFASEEVLTYYYDHLYQLSDEFKLSKDEQYIIPIEDYFMPYTVDGIAFLYNASMLEAFGMDMSDENQDGLVDAIDDYDKIFTLVSRYSYERPSYKGRTIYEYLPLCFNEATISYYLMSAGFTWFPTLEGDKPGFDSEDFYHALEFIYNMGKFPLASKKVLENKITTYPVYTSEDHVWQYEKIYTNDMAPFGLVTSWMDLESAMEHTNSNLVISKFPTYLGKQVSSLVNYQGFAILDSTKYPSAAHAVMDFLKENETMQVFMDATDKMMFIYDTYSFDYHENTNKKNYNMSLMYNSTHIPLLALPDNVYVAAMDYYKEGSYLTILKDLFDHKITVKKAQELFIKDYNTWYDEQTKPTHLTNDLNK